MTSLCTTKKFLLCFLRPAANLYDNLHLALTMISTRLMTKFLKRVKNGEFNLNPVMKSLQDHSQKFISSALLWSFARQGKMRLNDTMLTSKLQGMYLVYNSANELMLTENCHKILLVSV